MSQGISKFNHFTQESAKLMQMSFFRKLQNGIATRFLFQTWHKSELPNFGHRIRSAAHNLLAGGFASTWHGEKVSTGILDKALGTFSSKSLLINARTFHAVLWCSYESKLCRCAEIETNYY